jgi:dolichyl-phosphate-mannose--protein O-mannosyl transferase
MVRAFTSAALRAQASCADPLSRISARPMHSAQPAAQRDPIILSALIAFGLLALLWIRLHIPSKIYFDEVHYVKAARILLTMQHPQNPEHPMVGKEILAAGIWLFGDTPRSWRIFPALFGTFGLFAFARMVWWASQRRFATIAATLLLATDFAWFIQSRIAMLDIFMASFAMIAFWQLAAAVRLPQQARWRLALAGVALGLAMGSKWSIVGPAVVPGLAFLVIRLWTGRKRFLTTTEGAPIPGISLTEAALWLGSVPLIVYFATFLPTFFYPTKPVDPLHLIDYQQYMIRLQDSVVKHHTYQTVWWQWVLDWRGIWYLYENVDGAQRGIVLIGNPFSMIAGLPAVLWCLWAGIKEKRNDALAAALLYLVAIGMWVANGKPVQFYYHYLIPGTFLMVCLALALDRIWNLKDRKRWIAVGSIGVALAMFAFFFPIISAAKLYGGKKSFEYWMWLRSWR